MRLRTVLWVCLLLIPPVHAEDGKTTWPQWRGPSRDGQLLGPAWPENLSQAHLTQRWRVPLGPSYSGPIVAEDRVFVTETQDAKFEVVRALDRQSGKELWQAKWQGSIKVPFFAAANGDWIRSTPAYDGKSLYVAGMRDVLVSLDATTGKENWRLDLVKKYQGQVPAFGLVSSPLVLDGAVYVQAAGSFLKIDAATGKVIWRTLDKDGNAMTANPFGSPVLATIHGKPQLVVQMRKVVAGVEPASGTVLWSAPVPAFRDTNVLTPTILGNRVFTSSYGGGSRLFEVEKTGDGFSAKELWRNKNQGYMSTPVVIDDHLYLFLRNQRFCCIRAADGETRWVSRSFGKYWSLIARGDKILALDQRGELLLVAANPKEFTLLDRREVSEAETWAHLGLAGNQLFVRELDGLRVFDWK